MTDTGESGDDKWAAASEAPHKLAEGDFVQYEKNGEIREGEIAKRRERRVSIWEFKNGSPTGRTVEKDIDEVIFHPTGRREN